MRHFLIMTAAVGLMVAGSVGAATLSFNNAATTVSEGKSFTLDVNISGVSNLSDFEFDIGYDPTILKPLTVTEGSFLKKAGTTLFIPGSVDSLLGQVNNIADGLEGSGAGASGSGTLVQVTFKGIGSGTANLTLFDVTLLDSNLEGIANTTSGASVKVNGFSGSPEPSTLSLVGGAVLAGVLMRRRLGPARVV
jgi:hypothetical protein